MKIKLPNKFELWPIGKLKPYENNSHQHSEDKIKELSEIIKQFGFLIPILVDETSMITGHARLEAAKLLKMKEIPVSVVTHFTIAEKKAFVIAENQISKLSKFDEKKLAKEVFQIKEMGFDLKLLAFDMNKINAMLPDLTKAADNILKKNAKDSVYPSLEKSKDKSMKVKKKGKSKFDHECPVCGHEF